MAPKGTKRAASQAPKDIVAPKALKVKKANPMLDSLIETVDGATDLPDAVKAMLIAVIPGSFLTPAAERHESQVAAVRMVGEVVEMRRAKLKQDLDLEQAKVDSADTEKASLEDVVRTTESGLTAADAIAEEKRLAHSAAAEATAERQASLSQVETVQREGNAEFEASKQEKEQFESAFENHFKAVRDGVGEEGATERKQHYEALLPFVAKIGLDESLLTALPSSASKAPTARGPFDQTVIEELEKSLSQHIVRLAAAVDAATPAAEERLAAVQAARKALEEAQAAENAAAGDLSDARNVRAEAAEKVTAAKDAVAKFVVDSASFVKVRDEKEKTLRNFEQYDFECYTVLRDKSRDLSGVKDVAATPEKTVAVEVAGA